MKQIEPAAFFQHRRKSARRGGIRVRFYRPPAPNRVVVEGTEPPPPHVTARLYALACKYEQAAEVLLEGGAALDESEGRAAPAARTVLRGTYSRFAAGSSGR